MAGLGEVCSHIGAVMFYLLLTSEYCKRNLKEACTSLPCTWLPPSAKEVTFAPISDIDFKDPKKRLSEFGGTREKKMKISFGQNSSIAPTPQEKEDFYNKLDSLKCESAILRLIPPYNEKYISIKSKLLGTIFNFYDEKFEKYHYHELIQECLKKFMTLGITSDEVNLIETHTRKQANSNIWFKPQSGVITASNFKACCHSDVSQPSKSLIMQVCYPARNNFKTAATEYGLMSNL